MALRYPLGDPAPAEGARQVVGQSVLLEQYRRSQGLPSPPPDEPREEEDDERRRASNSRRPNDVTTSPPVHGIVPGRTEDDVATPVGGGEMTSGDGDGDGGGGGRAPSASFLARLLKEELILTFVEGLSSSLAITMYECGNS